MLTIFSIPKGFTGATARHQLNAIRSWRSLGPDVEIILFGNDPGVAEAATDVGAVHWPDVETTEFGTPLLGSVFRIAQERARWPTVMYSNADIVFFDDLAMAIPHLPRSQFLACGQRIDLDVTEELAVGDGSLALLAARMNAEGRLHAPAGSDYFIFPRKMVTMPAFSVGRPGWDNWLIRWARDARIPVIDATAAIRPLHQNHDYSHSKFGVRTHVRGPEHVENLRLAGGTTGMLDLRSANWTLGPRGLARKPPMSRALAATVSHPAVRALLGTLRAVRRVVGARLAPP